MVLELRHEEERTVFPDADKHEGARIFVLIVGVVEALLVRREKPMNLPSARPSMAVLRKFWEGLGNSGDVQTFGGAVHSVTLLPLQPTPERRYLGNDLLVLMTRAVREARQGDRVVVHWIGHGAKVPRQGDSCVYLPERVSGLEGEEAEPDVLFLRRIVRRFLSNCDAGQQFFFFDVCSATDPYLDWLGEAATGAHPDDAKPLKKGSAHFTLVASGDEGPAMSAGDDEASFFSNAFIAALRYHPNGLSGFVKADEAFEQALAAKIRIQWLESHAGQHPNPGLDFNNWGAGWYRRYVRCADVEPRFKLTGDVEMGRVSEIRMHAFFASLEAMKYDNATITFEDFAYAAPAIMYDFTAIGRMTSWGADVPLEKRSLVGDVVLTLTNTGVESGRFEVLGALPVAQHFMRATRRR